MYSCVTDAWRDRFIDQGQLLYSAHKGRGLEPFIHMFFNNLQTFSSTAKAKKHKI